MAWYNIQAGTVTDALGGTGVSGSVVFVKDDGTRRAAMTVVLPTKDQQEIHWALSNMARQYNAGAGAGFTPTVPAFRVVLKVNQDILATSEQP